MPQTLIDIGQAFAQIANMLDDLDGGELTPEMAIMLDEFFAEMGSARDEKLDSYVAAIRSHELRASVRREERDRLDRLVKADENVSARLKERLKWFMEATGDKKIETERYRISLRANGGVLPLEIADEKALSGEFVIMEPRPNKTAIREALTKGQEIAGCRLCERGSHVRID